MVRTAVLPSLDQALGSVDGGVEDHHGPASVKRPEINRVPPPEEWLFDDDAAGGSREAPSPLRRAHAMTRGDDDLLPTF
jgi:hypothetical protein